jgi:hypothetical protein
MRCLYCGKELALLKRWTSGGEFCSDAHRQQYQDEYNQLALNRLLQAKPANVEKKPAAESKPPAVSEEVESKRPGNPPATPAPRPSREPAPAARPGATRTFEMPASQQPVAEAQVEPEAKPVVETKKGGSKKEGVKTDPAPAPAEPIGFLVELPVPAVSEVTSMAKPETDLVHQEAPTLPSRAFGSWGTDLAVAGRVVLEPYSRVLDSPARPAERRLEVREFVRSAPVVEIDLLAASEAGLLETFKEPMEILIFAHPPQGSPPLWQEAEKEFDRIETELGPLAGVAFETTGLQDTEDGALRVRPASPEPPATPEPVLPEPIHVERVHVETVHIESSSIEPNPAETGGEAIAPEGLAPVVLTEPPLVTRPVPVPPAIPVPAVVVKVTAPLSSRLPFVRSAVISRPAEKPVPPAAEKNLDLAPDLTPDRVTQPMPLTLHGLAAGKGKPVQVFSSAVSSGVDVQIPRSSGLPLRPAMTLGPASSTPGGAAAKSDEKKPVDRTAVKGDQKKQQAARPDPRFANSRGRKPDVHILEQERKGPEKKETDKKNQETKTTPGSTSGIPKEPEPKPLEEPGLPAPLATPFTASDLGLPSLSMEASSGFWGKLPVAGKIGMAAALALVVGGVIELGMRGTGTAASVGPRVVEAGPALPATESGWITDWGVDPGVRRQRQISLLRPSMILSDYRMEFQGQIDTKAIGWIFRALDPKNYYVMKLEMVKPGLEPTVALVRFAMINGEEQPHAQFPLTMPVRLDTLYKIRFEALGNHFTTWVQDQKIDEWTDDRIRMGGAGLYSDRGERASLKGSLNVVPLVIRK